MFKIGRRGRPGGLWHNWAGCKTFVTRRGCASTWLAEQMGGGGGGVGGGGGGGGVAVGAVVVAVAWASA